MYHQSCFIDSLDDHQIHINIWKKTQSTKKANAILHICHGMAEHGSRYADTAERFVEAGFIVYAHDHRGHGQSVQHAELLGQFAEVDGWKKVVSDTLQVNQFIQSAHKDTPIIILGHSMGSFITQSYIVLHGNTVNGAILSGSMLNDKAALNFGTTLASLETRRQGPLGRSKVLDFFSFGIYNREFRPNRTHADWLTRDNKKVDEYINDPLCGFLCTNQFWKDMLNGLKDISRLSTLQKIPNKLPIFAISGKVDPMSYKKRKKHGIEQLVSLLKSSGQHYVDYKLYPDGRHEILNELNRNEVIDDLLSWIDSQLSLPMPKSDSNNNLTLESA